MFIKGSEPSGAHSWRQWRQMSRHGRRSHRLRKGEILVPLAGPPQRLLRRVDLALTAPLRRIKAELETQVEERTAALRQLSSRLLSLQDSERRRIARELHDSLGQYLVGLKLNAHMLRQAPEREELWAEARERAGLPDPKPDDAW